MNDKNNELGISSWKNFIRVNNLPINYYEKKLQG